MNQTKQEAAEQYTKHLRLDDWTKDNIQMAFLAGAEWAELKWIPVPERLPEKGQRVLFIVKSNDDWYHGKVWGGIYTGHDFATPGTGYFASHWCPIPKSLLNFKP